MLNNIYIMFGVAHDTMELLLARCWTKLNETEDLEKREEILEQIKVYDEQAKKVNAYDVDTITYVIDNYCPMIRKEFGH